LYAAEQVRITTWPTTTLPPLLVLRAPQIEVDIDGWVRTGGHRAWWPLPRELVLRDLQQVDCANPEDILAFIAEHGVITSAPRKMPHGWMRLEGHREIHERPNDDPLHIAELASYLRWAQGMTLHLVAALDGERVMSAWETVGIADAGFIWHEADDDVAWEWFAETLNAGLSGMQPYVMSWQKLPLSDERFHYGEPRVDLFTGMAAQVFNLAVEGMPMRSCANETCHQRFVRQLGRSRKGVSRTSGVMFCSSSCAKAQAQREYRRRQRQGKP
jgi:hypothetical protein